MSANNDQIEADNFNKGIMTGSVHVHSSSKLIGNNTHKVLKDDPQICLRVPINLNVNIDNQSEQALYKIAKRENSRHINIRKKNKLKKRTLHLSPSLNIISDKESENSYNRSHSNLHNHSSLIKLPSKYEIKMLSKVNSEDEEEGNKSSNESQYSQYLSHFEQYYKTTGKKNKKKSDIAKKSNLITALKSKPATNHKKNKKKVKYDPKTALNLDDYLLAKDTNEVRRQKLLLMRVNSE